MVERVSAGLMQDFPEIDRVDWFEPDEARRRLKPAQVAFVERLLTVLGETTAVEP